MPGAAALRPWAEVAYLLLVVGNIVAALLGGLLTAALGIYGLSYVLVVWYAPILMICGPFLARVGADQLHLGRRRLGFALMAAPVAAAAAAAAFHVMEVWAGERRYDLIGPA
jgi:hypothetical protein